MIRLTQRAREQEMRSKNGGAQRICSPPDRERRTPPGDTYGPRRRSAHRAVAERAAEPSRKGRPELHSSSQTPAGKHSSRRKIIGHSFSRTRLLRSAAKLAGVARTPLALQDQPAGKHGRRTLLHPLIEKLGHLRPEIGRKIQSGKFVALQRRGACREKKPPGGLGRGGVHDCLLACCMDNTGLVILVKPNRGVTGCA